MNSILIVDDDDVFQAQLERAFTRRDFQVKTASMYTEAYSRICDTAFDYAVLDLKIPYSTTDTEGSGLHVLEVLLKRSPYCRAVILTGYGTISTAVQAVKLGAVEYLTKPTQFERILNALIGSLDKEHSLQIPPPTPSLSQVEWEHIQQVLNACNGNISQAARELGMHRRSLQRKLAKDPGPLK